MVASTLLWLGLAASPARAGCEVTTTRVQLSEQVQIARAAFAAQDAPVLEAAAQDSRWVLGCIREQVGVRDVALVHLVIALDRWDADAPDAAVPWLARYAAAFPPVEGARDPLPAGLTEPERQVFAQVLQPVLDFEVQAGPRLPPPFPGKVLLDGDPTQRRAPKNAPYVFQRFSGRRVLQTDVIEPGQKRLPYPRVRPLLLGQGLGAAAISTGLFLGASSVQGSLDTWTPADGTGDKTEAEYFLARSRLNHGLFVGGVATATLSALALSGYGLSFVF